jgi:hypothetical protein
LDLQLAGGEIKFGRERCGWGEFDLVVGAKGEPAGEVEGGGGFGCDRLDGDPAQLRGIVGSAGEGCEKEKREGEAEGE